MGKGAAGGVARRGSSGSPWQEIVDACSSAAKRFADPVAMEGMTAASTAADAIEALGKALSNVGKTTTDAVWIDPRVTEYMTELGQYVLKAVEPTRDTGAAILKAHQERIDRVVANDPKERRWDLSAHDGTSRRLGIGRRTG